MGSQFQVHQLIGETKDPYPSLKAALQQVWRWADQHRHGLRECLCVGTGLAGYPVLPANDLPALSAALDSSTVAVVLRPAHAADLCGEYLREAAQLCRLLNILLMVDERLLADNPGLEAELIFQEREGAEPTVVYLPRTERWLMRLGQVFA